jgi:outer membrane protein assembly factor BamE (lipoprotein component of BamABCDE complex)
MRNFTGLALLLVAVAGNASAQASIDPGMTRDQVVGKLGKPTSEHSSGSATFLYYKNGQERKMGMSDMVALDSGKVVDAVFRSGARRYTGRSSSPAPVSAEAAIAKGNGGKAPPMNMPAARKSPETKKAAAAARAPEAKKAVPAAKAPETKKAAPPTARKPEPLTKADAKKIQKIPAPPKSPDATKKAVPAPTKRP